jgi:ribonuclease HI
VFTGPHWTLFFDGSARCKKAGAGVVLIDPHGEQVKYMVHLDFEATNNMAEYEALIFGLTVALSLGVWELLVKGDSQLIIRQVRGMLLQQSPAHNLPHPREEAGEGLRCAGTATCSTRRQLSG